MSLVNDMLKDLDQRRSGSGSNGSRVKLTPASEFPKGASNIKPVYALGFLIVVVALLAFIWLQISSAPASRSFESQPVGNSPYEVAQPASNGLDIEPRDTEGVLESSQSRPVAETVNEPAVPEFEGSPLNILLQAVKQRSASMPQPELYRPPEELDESVVLESDAIIDGGLESVESVDLLAGVGIDESVKDDAVISEDQQDAMAVQRSLRLLADNKMQEAYANFENHISENRYAHQSRETYGKLLLNEGNLQAAYNLIEQGLDLAPNNPGFKKVKARILIASGQVMDAVELLSSKAPPVAEDVEYHEILASTQLATKDYAGAAISYSELVGADQSQGKFWYGYAAAQELLGNADVARQAYSRAVQQPSLSTSLRRRSQDRLLALRE